MTTWDNSDITRIKHNRRGSLKELVYTINGISGDTGGTLTTKFSHIEAIAVQAQVDTGPAGYATALVYHLNGATVVVAYTNPADGHTVRITVIGT